jgi:hypothetical protein
MMQCATLRLLKHGVPQEDGWVVCRVFMKKSIQRGFDQQGMAAAAAVDDDELLHSFQHYSPGASAATPVADQKHGLHQQLMHGGFFPAFDPSMHLPHLTSAEAPPLGTTGFMSGSPPAVAVNPLGMASSSSQNLVKLTPPCGTAGDMPLNGGERFGAAAAADWSILDKLLASHQNLDQLFHGKFGGTPPVGVSQHYHQRQQQWMEMSASSLQRLPLHYFGCETADLKFSM